MLHNRSSDAIIYHLLLGGCVKMSALTFDHKSPMPALLKLVDNLASPALSHQTIKDGLRVLGFRASIAGVKQVLTVSSALNPHFQKLETVFPSAQKILGDFGHSKSILAALDSATDFPCNEPIRSDYIAAPFCAAIGHHEFQPVDFDQYPNLAELIAFFWLVHSSIHAQPNIVVPDKLAKLLHASLDFARYASFAAKDYPDLVSKSQISLNNGIANWIDFSGPLFEKCAPNPPTIEEIHDGFVEAFELVSQLHSRQWTETKLPPDSEQEELPPKATQRDSMLRERERLNVHHNAFQAPEMKSFAKSVRSVIEHEEHNYNKNIIGATTQYFFEALIVALALATGRAVRGAIEFPLYSDSPEHISIQLFGGYNGNFNYPIWTRTISPDTTLKLPLPEFLECLKRRHIRFDGAHTLEDCLPYSLVPWEDRCFEWLESLTSVSKHRLNRRIRDALTRAIYQDSANPALLNWITTPIQKSNRQLESLSHYLDPLSERTVEAYSDACTKIFNKYGARKETINVFNKKVFGITSAEHRLIAQLFLNNLQQAEVARDYIAYHNALALYVLMLLIVATGHRKSNTPFFFPWDILTSEDLVFISDKLTVGSESRFVPIPAWLSKLVEGYHLHLQDLSDRIRSVNHELANGISLVAKGDSSNRPRGKPSSSSSQPTFGQFFLIDKDFKVRTITTRDLEKFYRQSSTKGIGLFRKSVANSLWSQQLSGHQIEAFLGHNGELHAFGESSAWSIVKWAERVREAQDRYLTDSGWKTNIKSTASSSGAQPPLTPCFCKSTESYEGRSLARDAAEANARMIIRDLLPSEWFTAQDARITDEDVVRLKEAARERLSDDPESCEKVCQAIAKEIGKIRNLIDGTVSSSIANLTRTKPGPIAVTSSRHFAIASAIRAWWIDRLGDFSDDSSENFVDRLASIGFSLIVFDTVLDKSTWVQLLSAIANHETRSAKGCLVVRAQVEKSSRIFDKSLVLSPYTAAQIAGLELKHHSTKPDGLTIKAVTKRIVKWLKGAPHTGESLSLEKLITVFRAWWLPRLSGTEFAIAIGNYSGPAPDIASECALFGIQRTDSVASSSDNDIKAILANPKLNRSSTKSKIDHLLSDAAGSFERKEQTSRRQRNELLRLLQKEDKYADLRAMANQRPIVSAMLGFLQHMLDEGGIRVDVYRFGSIRTYFSHVNSLIDIWWDINLEDLETEDYDEAYSSLLKASSQSAFPIWLFHKLLRETRDAPHTTVATSYERSLTQCRSALITTGQFEKAWKEIGLLKDDGQLVHHTKTFMGASYQYALRTREALGLDLSHVVLPRPFGILVEKNSVRDLKTKGASLRLTQPLLANTKYQKHLGGVVALCEKSPVRNASLFSDAEKKNSLYSRSSINQATTSVLRTATGNLSVVPYSMRHSAATRLAHFVFNSPRSIPLSTFVEGALKDEIGTNSITACFDQGFVAWPFWTDRVSMFLGHTSVDTLLNTYWHSSHIRLAEQTWHASENINLTNKQIASMLGKERSSITTQIGRLKEAHADEALRIQEALIVHYINKSKIPEMGDEFKVDQQKLTSRMPSGDPVFQDECGSWVAFHRLLSSRFQDSLSIDDTIKLSVQFNLPSADAAAFLGVYEDIVRNNGFDDFEPWNSQLTIGKSKRSSGVQRGTVERERGIAAAQRLLHETDTFGARLEEFASLWIDRTDPAAPWFVARNVDELDLIVEILSGVGVTRSQFDFISCNFDISKLSGILTKPELSIVKEQTSRVSAGPRNARVCEFGIRVKQQPGAKIGDFRDTHRLALVLAAIIRSKNS